MGLNQEAIDAARPDQPALRAEEAEEVTKMEELVAEEMDRVLDPADKE